MKHELNIKKIDIMLLISMLLLITVGTIMLFSTSSIIGLTNYNNSLFFIKKHIIFLFLGFIGLSIGFTVPHTIYKKFSTLIFFSSSLILGLTLIPQISITTGGATRWLNLIIFQLQPIEITKFGIIVVISAIIHNKHTSMQSWKKGILPILILISIPIGILAKQPDLGNIMLILIVIVILLFLAKTKLLHLGLLLIGGIGLIALYISRNPYQMERITSFLNPWSDPLGKTYHITQSFIAIGSGGLLGQGLGESQLKYFYLPLQYSDFIFSIICEEGGFITAFIIICTFIYLFYRGLVIARKTYSTFSSLLAIGLTLLITIQAFINMAVVCGLIPITGIPLTFISFGGTSLIMSMFFIGVLLNISMTKKPK